MTSVWQLPALIGAVLAWLTAQPTSLADVARHEAVRRALMPRSAGVYTNADLPSLRPSDRVLTETASPAGAESDKSGESGESDEADTIEGPVSGAQAAQPAQGALPAPADQTAWRARASDLVTTIDRDSVIGAGLQARVVSLQNDILRRDDPAQRAQLAQELAKTLTELDRHMAAARQHAADLEKLRDEARRLGVPPGWLRP